MKLIDAIHRAKTIVQQLDYEQSSPLITSLTSELNRIETLATELVDGLNQSNSASLQRNSPEMESGCYIFADEKGFFCPHCYDNTGNKIATTRINSKLRVCPACRTTIK